MDSCGLKNFSNIIVRTYKEVGVDFDDPPDKLGSCDISESISRTLYVLVTLVTTFSEHESLLIVQEGLPENPYIGSSLVLRRWNQQFKLLLIHRRWHAA
jgi:hypothetical protein